jgi:hypothetical protein
MMAPPFDSFGDHQLAWVAEARASASSSLDNRLAHNDTKQATMPAVTSGCNERTGGGGSAEVQSGDDLSAAG